MSEWQPIESVPRDGKTKVDLFYPYPRCRQIDMVFHTEGLFAGYWVSKRPTWGFVDGNYQILPTEEWLFYTFPNMEPTHWMLAPVVPEPHDQTASDLDQINKGEVVLG